MTRKLRWLVPFLALAATMVAGTASAAAAPTVPLDGVRTTLWTDPATTKVLLANRIVPLPTFGTHIDVKWTPHGPSVGYGFPIPSGRVDAATLAGSINHTGGLRFVNLANGKQLSLTRFRIVIDAHPHLTAIVNGDPKARVSILRLDLSEATVSKPLPHVRVGNVGAYLNSTAAGALNSALGVSFFAPGIKLGTAYVNAHVAGRPRGGDVNATHPAPGSVTRLRPTVDIAAAENAVRNLLHSLGSDLADESLADTPGRVARMYAEMLTPEPFDLTTFPNDERYDELVIARNIPFHSLCEHHLLPFHGVAHVAYLPGERILGLSKLARVVDLFAAGLQVQERLTRQVSAWLQEHLEPRGVGVVLEAEHLCMSLRGVSKPGVTTVTSALHGLIRTDPRTRDEFLALARAGR